MYTISRYCNRFVYSPLRIHCYGQSTLLFHDCQDVPSSSSTFLNSENNIMINIFIKNVMCKHFDLIQHKSSRPEKLVDTRVAECLENIWLLALLDMDLDKTCPIALP